MSTVGSISLRSIVFHLFPPPFFPLFSHSSLTFAGAILYVNFVNGTKNNGCYYYDQIIAAITQMAPLVTVITSNRHSTDIGDLSEPYGSLDSYQNSGLALTLINIPAWTVVEQIIASTPNVTASITPCKRPLWFLVFLLHPSSFLPSFLYLAVVGYWILYARSPALPAYQGITISIYVSCFLFVFAMTNTPHEWRPKPSSSNEHADPLHLLRHRPNDPTTSEGWVLLDLSSPECLLLLLHGLRFPSP